MRHTTPTTWDYYDRPYYDRPYYDRPYYNNNGGAYRGGGGYRNFIVTINLNKSYSNKWNRTVIGMQGVEERMDL